MFGASSPFNNNKHVRFVAVGRYHIDKGFDMLVRAFAQVKVHIPNAELYVVGAYDENNEVYRNVRQFVEDEHLEDCVFCVGFKENPYIYMRYADCFVLSSRNEGLPNVMIEALYLGTPVAAMKCIPVIQRIVAECKNGYLASAGNVTELAEAMNKASKLGRIQTTYNQNSEKKFEEVFLKI